MLYSLYTDCTTGLLRTTNSQIVNMSAPMDQDWTSLQVGKRKAREFLDELAKKTPTKSRRLSIAAERAVNEREREKVCARIRKNKERMSDLVSKFEADEIEKARLDEKIHR